MICAKSSPFFVLYISLPLNIRYQDGRRAVKDKLSLVSLDSRLYMGSCLGCAVSDQRAAVLTQSLVLIPLVAYSQWLKWAELVGIADPFLLNI